jgi:hypothetical protein
LRATERRLARLERLRRIAEQRDPAEVCDLVVRWYDDPENVKLPEFVGEEKRIAEAMANMLHISDQKNWWDYEGTLPLKADELGWRK